MKLNFTDPGVPRFSDRPLPAYRHLPFKNPHPFLDEEGHSYAEKLTPPDSFGPDNWQDCFDYLYSIDLFNHGFWWEAHERLKHVSIGAGRESDSGKFIQGLIQLAAAMLKHFMQETEAAATLAELGLENLQVDGTTYLGIEVTKLSSEIEYCLKAGEAKYPSIHLKDI